MKHLSQLCVLKDTPSCQQREQWGCLGKSYPVLEDLLPVQDLQVRGLFLRQCTDQSGGQSSDYLGGLYGILFKRMVLTRSFHSKEASSGSGDSDTLARHALSTFAANSMEILGICALRVGSSANQIILHFASNQHTNSALITHIRGLLDQKWASFYVHKKPNSKQ